MSSELLYWLKARLSGITMRTSFGDVAVSQEKTGPTEIFHRYFWHENAKTNHLLNSNWQNSYIWDNHIVLMMQNLDFTINNEVNGFDLPVLLLFARCSSTQNFCLDKELISELKWGGLFFVHRKSPKKCPLSVLVRECSNLRKSCVSRDYRFCVCTSATELPIFRSS